jgi:N-acetylglutamate synthase-like GNAT family acetyltransferase
MKRLRPIRRKMSWAAFERLPRRMGWKHEYFEGTAYLRPASRHVPFTLDLAPRDPGRRRGIRPVTPDDEPALRQPFLEAFALAPEYAGYPMAKFRQAAAKYLAGYFGDVRGTPSPVSVVAESRGEIIGAALVKDRPEGPLLDCIFVRPDHNRKGWATALAAHAVNELVRRVAAQLRSYAMLANAASLAWHARFGFREVPNEWVAGARWRHYTYELERHDRLGDLSPAERAELKARVDYWAKESDCLERQALQAIAAAHPRE